MATFYVFDVHFMLVVVRLVVTPLHWHRQIVSASAIDCVEKLVSQMTCYVTRLELDVKFYSPTHFVSWPAGQTETEMCFATSSELRNCQSRMTLSLPHVSS